MEIDGYLKLLVEADLPSDPQQRFAMLFRNKKQWKLHEITPYVIEIVPIGSSVEELLLQWTISFPSNDTEMIYCSRDVAI